MKTVEDAHHITVNGKPYCHVESDGRTFDSAKCYPTNCGHGSRESAEEGVKNCKNLQPDLNYNVVKGPCSEDPFWSTPEGRAAIELEFELDEMRWFS